MGSRLRSVLNENVAATGREVTVIWGEENGGSRRPVVERHLQKEIRATVTGWPYSKLAQRGYRTSR